MYRAECETCFIDLLEISGTVVYNFLVDQKTIESVSVARSQQEAKMLTTGSVPRGIMLLLNSHVSSGILYSISAYFYR